MPVSLTASMTNPQDVVMQKEVYKHSLDEQLKQGEALLNQQAMRQQEHIRLQAEQQKALAIGRWDQQLRAQEMAAEQEYQQQLAKLQDDARQKKVLLEKQASEAIMEYNARKTQQEINYRHFQLQMQRWQAQQQSLDISSASS